MTFTLSDTPAATVLKLRGEFDLSNTADVEDALAQAVGSADRTVVVDLSDMTFAGTTMIRALLAGQAAAMAQGKRMLVIRPTPIVWHAFELMGLEDVFSAFDTLEAALAAEHDG